MTPREKAENLVQRFIYRRTDYVEVEDAKQCALIAVEEVINSMTVATSVYLPFWQNVKIEIEKL